MLSRFRYLQSHSDLVNFIEKANEHIGVRFPVEYLAKNKVLGYFDSKGELKGGVAFIITAPFRVADSLPPEGKKRLEKIVPDMEKDAFEITALWLDRSERKKTTSMFFWLAMYIAVLRLDRPYFIYAYSSAKSKLGEIYSVCNPTEVYRGYTKILPGMKDIDHEVVEVGSIRSVQKAIFTKPGFLFKRAVRPLTRQRRQEYAQGA